ncbi:MAG: CbiX/SirB N-terminal domain-containing protein [Pseudorhodobacter sp.]
MTGYIDAAEGGKLDAILVAHGAPADPVSQDAAMARLALQVAARLPGWDIRGATLAMEGSLARAVAAMDAPLIYPFFMAEGWFTRTLLPQRLVDAGGTDLKILRPFGANPALPELMIRAARDGAAGAGLVPSQTTLLIAAHGSQVARSSAEMTEDLARIMRERAGFARVVTGFVEEAPFLQEAACGIGPALCLPLFALSAGHVTGDVPEALAAACFTGPILPPVGAMPEVPDIIAATLQGVLNAEGSR